MVAVLVGAISSLPETAPAFTLSPMKVTLNAEGDTQTIRVKNPSDQPVDMQMQIFGWSDSEDLEALTPTEDILAMPPIFTVEPGGEQTVRVALRHPIDGESERSYRVVIAEVSPEVGKPTGLGFSLAVSIPLFVHPDGAEAAPVWTIEKTDAEGHALVLANEGKAYLKVAQVTLGYDDAAAGAVFEAQGGYVLAGDRRSWPLDPDVSGLKGPFVLRAESNIGPIESVVTLPES